MIDMAAAFGESQATFQQEAANLVDHGRSSHHPALSHSMHGLQIQMLLGFDRHEAHRWPLYCFRDGFCIDVVALVGLYIGLDVLSWHQSYVVPLSSQGSPKEMRSTTSLHPDYLDAHVCGVRQQLRSRTPFANDDVPARIEAHQVKHCLAQINANRM